MPLPLIPALIAIGSLAAGGYGVKKGFDAKEDMDRAKSIGSDANRRHKEAVAALEKNRNKTNRQFENLGKLKATIFSHQIKLLVDEIEKRGKGGSELKDFKESIEKLDLPSLKKMVINSLEIETGLLSGTASGALAGLGAYGSVGMLASASTGTAIASLSGAAATNATLAWLGGGALSAGGLGMAGGTAVLGGFVAGPAIAITGFMMASKAEEALTKARAYEADVDEKIAEIEGMEVILQGLQANTKEMTRVLKQLVPYFDEAANDLSRDPATFDRLLNVGLSLKDVLNTPILEKDGSATKNIESKLRTKVKHTGLLEYGSKK